MVVKTTENKTLPAVAIRFEPSEEAKILEVAEETPDPLDFAIT